MRDSLDPDRPHDPEDPNDIVEHGHVIEDDPFAATDDSETWSPPTDPVVKPTDEGDLAVVGGFSPSSMDDDPAVPRPVTGGIPDEALADAIGRELREDATTTDLDVSVEVEEGVAYLRGRGAGLEDVDNAMEVAGRVPGLVEVVDELEVEAR